MKIFSSNKTIKDNRNFTHIKDVKYDGCSYDPEWVDYNTERRKTTLANLRGYKSIHTRLSIATEERLLNDGYSIRMVEGNEMETNPNDPEWPLNYIVSWTSLLPPKSKLFVAPWKKKLQEEKERKKLEESEFKWRTSEPYSMVEYLEEFLNKLRINGVEPENIKIADSRVFYLHQTVIE